MNKMSSDSDSEDTLTFPVADTTQNVLEVLKKARALEEKRKPVLGNPDIEEDIKKNFRRSVVRRATQPGAITSTPGPSKSNFIVENVSSIEYSSVESDFKCPAVVSKKKSKVVSENAQAIRRELSALRSEVNEFEYFNQKPDQQKSLHNTKSTSKIIEICSKDDVSDSENEINHCSKQTLPKKQTEISHNQFNKSSLQNSSKNTQKSNYSLRANNDQLNYRDRVVISRVENDIIHDLKPTSITKLKGLSHNHSNQSEQNQSTNNKQKSHYSLRANKNLLNDKTVDLRTNIHLNNSKRQYKNKYADVVSDERTNNNTIKCNSPQNYPSIADIEEMQDKTITSEKVLTTRVRKELANSLKDILESSNKQGDNQVGHHSSRIFPKNTSTIPRTIDPQSTQDTYSSTSEEQKMLKNTHKSQLTSNKIDSKRNLRHQHTSSRAFKTKKRKDRFLNDASDTENTNKKLQKGIKKGTKYCRNKNDSEISYSSSSESERDDEVKCWKTKYDKHTLNNRKSRHRSRRPNEISEDSSRSESHKRARYREITPSSSSESERSTRSKTSNRKSRSRTVKRENSVRSRNSRYTSKESKKIKTRTHHRHAKHMKHSRRIDRSYSSPRGLKEKSIRKHRSRSKLVYNSKDRDISGRRNRTNEYSKELGRSRVIRVRSTSQTSAEEMLSSESNERMKKKNQQAIQKHNNSENSTTESSTLVEERVNKPKHKTNPSSLKNDISQSGGRLIEILSKKMKKMMSEELKKMEENRKLRLLSMRDSSTPITTEATYELKQNNCPRPERLEADIPQTKRLTLLIKEPHPFDSYVNNQHLPFSQSDHSNIKNSFIIPPKSKILRQIARNPTKYVNDDIQKILQDFEAFTSIDSDTQVIQNNKRKSKRLSKVHQNKEDKNVNSVLMSLWQQKLDKPNRLQELSSSKRQSGRSVLDKIMGFSPENHHETNNINNRIIKLKETGTQYSIGTPEKIKDKSRKSNPQDKSLHLTNRKPFTIVAQSTFLDNSENKRSDMFESRKETERKSNRQDDEDFSVICISSILSDEADEEAMPLANISSVPREISKRNEKSNLELPSSRIILDNVPEENDYCETENVNQIDSVGNKENMAVCTKKSIGNTQKSNISKLETTLKTKNILKINKKDLGTSLKQNKRNVEMNCDSEEDESDINLNVKTPEKIRTKSSKRIQTVYNNNNSSVYNDNTKDKMERKLSESEKEESDSLLQETADGKKSSGTSICDGKVLAQLNKEKKKNKQKVEMSKYTEDESDTNLNVKTPEKLKEKSLKQVETLNNINNSKVYKQKTKEKMERKLSESEKEETDSFLQETVDRKKSSGTSICDGKNLAQGNKEKKKNKQKVEMNKYTEEEQSESDTSLNLKTPEKIKTKSSNRVENNNSSKVYKQKTKEKMERKLSESEKEESDSFLQETTDRKKSTGTSTYDGKSLPQENKGKNVGSENKKNKPGAIHNDSDNTQLHLHKSIEIDNFINNQQNVIEEFDNEDELPHTPYKKTVNIIQNVTIKKGKRSKRSKNVGTSPDNEAFDKQVILEPDLGNKENPRSSEPRVILERLDFMQSSIAQEKAEGITNKALTSNISNSLSNYKYLEPVVVTERIGLLTDESLLEDDTNEKKIEKKKYSKNDKQKKQANGKAKPKLKGRKKRDLSAEIHKLEESSIGIRKSSRVRRPPRQCWWKEKLTKEDHKIYGYMFDDDPVIRTPSPIKKRKTKKEKANKLKESGMTHEKTKMDEVRHETEHNFYDFAEPSTSGIKHKPLKKNLTDVTRADEPMKDCRGARNARANSKDDPGYATGGSSVEITCDGTMDLKACVEASKEIDVSWKNFSSSEDLFQSFKCLNISKSINFQSLFGYISLQPSQKRATVNKKYKTYFHVIRGGCSVQYGDKYVVKINEIFIIPRGVHYLLENNGDSLAVLLYILGEEPEDMKNQNSS